MELPKLTGKISSGYNSPMDHLRHLLRNVGDAHVGVYFVVCRLNVCVLGCLFLWVCGWGLVVVVMCKLQLGYEKELPFFMEYLKEDPPEARLPM